VGNFSKNLVRCPFELRIVAIDRQYPFTPLEKIAISIQLNTEKNKEIFAKKTPKTQLLSTNPR